MFQRAVVVALGIVISLGAAGVTRAQPRPAGPAPPRPASQPPPRPTGREMKVAMLLASDKPSTDAGLAGLEAVKKHGRLAVTVRLAPQPDELSPMIDRLAAGAPDLIIGLGPVYRDAFRMASAQHPHTRFLLLDAELPSVPNVRAATFRADEGSFLAGVAASAESKRGAVGFIGTTPEAFSDPEHGSKVSRTMITEKHVDVLYAAAGASSAGVIEAAREAKVRAIGGDAEPTHLPREVLITSVRKRIDRVIERAIADVRKQSYHGGTVEMNLANGGVDLALPGRMAPATQKLVERALAAIVSGREAPCVKYEETPSAWNFPPRPAAP